MPSGHDYTQDSAAATHVDVDLCRYMDQQLNLCQRLERVADSLPDTADEMECLHLARALLPLVKKAHDFEEQTVFPGLLRHPLATPALRESLERLRFEHLGDEDFANDLSLALRQFATARESCNVESLAWMLRGFFESLRRHIAFEKEHVLPLVRQTRPAA